MLVPIVVRANYKVGATKVDVQLESILGSNLPVLFPTVTVMCRTDSVSVTPSVTTQFTNQVDPDFNGSVVKTDPIISLTSGTQADIKLSSTLHPTAQGVSHTLSLAKTGVAVEAQVSILIRGMVETSISPDPQVTVNV